MRTIVALPGDGIGKVVLPESIRLLEAAGFNGEYIYGDIGWDFWCKEGNALPQRTIDLIARHKIALFGAITSKPKDAAEKELRQNIDDVEGEKEERDFLKGISGERVGVLEDGEKKEKETADYADYTD